MYLCVIDNACSEDSGVRSECNKTLQHLNTMAMSLTQTVPSNTFIAGELSSAHLIRLIDHVPANDQYGVVIGVTFVSSTAALIFSFAILLDCITSKKLKGTKRRQFNRNKVEQISILSSASPDVLMNNGCATNIEVAIDCDRTVYDSKLELMDISEGDCNYQEPQCLQFYQAWPDKTKLVSLEAYLLSKYGEIPNVLKDFSFLSETFVVPNVTQKTRNGILVAKKQKHCDIRELNYKRYKKSLRSNSTIGNNSNAMRRTEYCTARSKDRSNQTSSSHKIYLTD